MHGDEELERGCGALEEDDVTGGRTAGATVACIDDVALVESSVSMPAMESRDGASSSPSASRKRTKTEFEPRGAWIDVVAYTKQNKTTI